MKVKIPVNAILGISVEVIYTLAIMLVAFCICLAITLHR